jgi:predicted RNase H-like nuclease (RuvC/YqgF family)
MSDLVKIEKLLTELTVSVKNLESEMGSMKSEMGSMKSEMGSMKSEMGSRFDRLEDTVNDLRTEMRDDSAATRALLNQAFEHISDQIALDGKPIQPSIVFRTQRHNVTV